MSGHQKSMISQRVFLLSALFSAPNHVKQYLDIPLIGLGASTNEIFLHKILEQSRTLIYLGKSGYKGICLQHTAGLYDPECISVPKGSSVLPPTASWRIEDVEKTFSPSPLPFGGESAAQIFSNNYPNWQRCTYFM